MSLPMRESVLLTGAGFTANFGGVLASEMWSRLFNHREVQRSPSLVHMLKQDFDFEAVYHQVMYGTASTPQEQHAFHTAVLDVYTQLDESVRYCWAPGGACPVSRQGVGNLLEDFASAGQERGFVFTLNQDFFVERWHLGMNKLLHTPGMEIRHRSPCTDDRETLSYTVPSIDDLEAKHDQYEEAHPANYLYYIKLHGSMNWRTSDGREVMVIGGDKPGQIGREPLLDWYFEIFQRVLSAPRRRLLVIGYGFGDDHVNESIARAIMEQGLRLCVICPMPPSTFKDALPRKSPQYGRTLWEGLSGYWEKGLQDIYPAYDPHTRLAEEIRTALFH
jgi:SIR2-like domain